MTELKKEPDDDIPPLQIDGLLGWFDLVVGKYGGPGQFLNAVMTNEKDKDPFQGKVVSRHPQVIMQLLRAFQPASRQIAREDALWTA